MLHCSAAISEGKAAQDHVIDRGEICCAGTKYAVKVTRQGPQAFRLFLGNNYVDVVARYLNDGGLLVQVKLFRAGPAHYSWTCFASQLHCLTLVSKTPSAASSCTSDDSNLL